MVKKLLILAETIDIDASSAGKANAGFIQSLLIAGFDVSVLHYSHKEVVLQSLRPILISEYKADINYWFSRGQRVIQRITGKNFSKSLENKFGFSFTFMNDANSMARSLKKVKSDFDLLITLSKGASYRTHAAVLKCPEFHQKWLAYMHDPYPFHLYPPPYNWEEAGCTQKEAFFTAVSQKARFTGFPSMRLQEWMGKFFPNFLNTGYILPHQNLASTAIGEQKAPIYYKQDAFTVLHAGNLLGYRNPFHLIEAFVAFLSKRPTASQEAQLLFLGPADYHEPQFSEHCAQEINIHKSDGYVPYSEVNYLQNNVTVNVIIEADAEESPFLPGKFPHCVAADAPILLLSPSTSESSRLLGTDYPFTCRPSDVKAITNSLVKLYDQWKVNNKELRLQREDLTNYFSSTYLGEVLNKVIATNNE